MGDAERPMSARVSNQVDHHIVWLRSAHVNSTKVATKNLGITGTLLLSPKRRRLWKFTLCTRVSPFLRKSIRGTRLLDGDSSKDYI